MKKPKRDSAAKILQDVADIPCYDCEASKHGWPWSKAMGWDNKRQHDRLCVTFRARALQARKGVKK